MSKTTKKRLYHLEKYIQNKWDEYYWNFVMKYGDKLEGYWLSENPNITIEMIEKYPNKPWDWRYIGRNPNITMGVIEKYPDKHWDWNYISMNKNLTMEFIEKYPTKFWSWTAISRNAFTKEKELFYEEYYRIYMATLRLQQYFNRMYDNPKYLFCRKRLDKLFSA